MLREILVSEKELSDINFERLENALMNLKNNFIDCDNNIYLIFDSLVGISNITTGSNNTFLNKVNYKLRGYDKMCMDKDLIEEKLYQLTEQFNKKNRSHSFLFRIT